MYEIENVAMSKPVNKGPGLTKQLGMLNVGQSILVDRSYPHIYATIRFARARVKNPLVGEFVIAPEGDGKHRVGRVE